ncbi:hypothetical protein [Magnetofaba australis]|uniref:hypothetical protein n=1 Tax=Magnetofaba australis TaxID=1472297 RepID=UPI000A19DE58|nr:hypothetical protein [Magnetofaba australis]
MAMTATTNALSATGAGAKVSIASVAKAQFIKEAGMGLGMGLGMGAWLGIGALVAWLAWRQFSR